MQPDFYVITAKGKLDLRPLPKKDKDKDKRKELAADGGKGSSLDSPMEDIPKERIKADIEDTSQKSSEPSFP